MKNTKKIMVVDDEENIVELVRALLEKEGFKVIPAYSGMECLAKLKKIKPDLVLLDMFMPGISGRETCGRIRRDPKTKDLKVIFLTVAAFPEMEGVLREMNISDYIRKPFDNADLIRRVKEAL